jgi:hypothetical protein
MTGEAYVFLCPAGEYDVVFERVAVTPQKIVVRGRESASIDIQGFRLGHVQGQTEPHALLRLYALRDKREVLVRECVAGGDGRFDMRDLACGPYAVVARLSEDANAIRHFEIKDNTPVDIGVLSSRTITILIKAGGNNSETLSSAVRWSEWPEIEAEVRQVSLDSEGKIRLSVSEEAKRVLLQFKMAQIWVELSRGSSVYHVATPRSQVRTLFQLKPGVMRTSRDAVLQCIRGENGQLSLLDAEELAPDTFALVGAPPLGAIFLRSPAGGVMQPLSCEPTTDRVLGDVPGATCFDYPITDRGTSPCAYLIDWNGVAIAHLKWKIWVNRNDSGQYAVGLPTGFVAEVASPDGKWRRRINGNQ